MLKSMTRLENFHRHGLTVFIVNVILMMAFTSIVSAQDIARRQFKSPQEAFKALLHAAKNNDTKELLAIFGTEGKDIIASGDAVADTEARKRFVKAAGEGIRFIKLDKLTTLALIGKDRWSFPIPLVITEHEWVFSTEEGKEEILNRRIGRNELNTIQVALAYVAAQREYASKDRIGDGVLQYAQHFLSQKGKKDGLYWEATPEEEISPLGPLVARSNEEGYVFRKGEIPIPYHGYYFKILKSQGSSAPGGKLDYMVAGRLVRGFGLLAYPAEYGVSGIMTFVVNHQCVVYEKDLGFRTKERVKEMTGYDPDRSWHKVENSSAGHRR